MPKDCGPTPSAELLTKNIEGAKGEIDGLIGDSLGGLADSNVNIKDKISGLTDGIGADLEGFAPDIPEPQFSLQGQMENLLNNTDNPGASAEGGPWSCGRTPQQRCAPAPIRARR